MNYLITGLPGTGKTAVGCALQQMGYRVIHADEQLVSVKAQPWNWDQAKADRLLKGETGIFVCGGADNLGRFLAYFKKVFVLSAPDVEINRRLAQQKRPPLDRIRPVAPIAGTLINASRPIRAVVHDILRRV